MITLILTKQYWLNYQTDNFQFVRDENAGGIIAPPAFLTSYSLPQPIYLPAAHNLPQADDFLLSAVHFWQSPHSPCVCDIQCLSPAKKYGKKQVRNITSWICDGKFVKAMSIAKRIFLAFINISFFDGELKMCLSLIWYCL